MVYEVAINLVDFQYEGVNTIFDKFKRLGVDHINLNCMWFKETGDPNDSRLPPLDIDGENRVFDRPFPDGTFVKYGKYFLPFKPDLSLYGKLVPLKYDDSSDILDQVMAEAKKRNIEVTLMIPNDTICDNADTLPMDINGNRHPAQISKKGCINNEDILHFYKAMTKQIISTYHPERIMIDWVEYTNYFLSDNFNCLCPSCAAAAGTMGYDYDLLRDAVVETYRILKEIDTIPEGNNWDELWNNINPKIKMFFDFKATSCFRFISRLVEDVRTYDQNVKFLFTCFAPPMNKGTGFNFEVLSKLGDDVIIQPKMYRFHWGLMVNWYASELYRINPKISLSDWVLFAKKLLEVEDSSCDINHFKMPSPKEIGPVDFETEWKKISSLKQYDLDSYRVHAYCPDELLATRLQQAQDSGMNYISIQRYGYISDKKFEILSRFTKRT